MLQSLFVAVFTVCRIVVVLGPDIPFSCPALEFSFLLMECLGFLCFLLSHKTIGSQKQASWLQLKITAFVTKQSLFYGGN